MPDTDTDTIYPYCLDLPEFVIVGETGEKIPGTSSSMLRYYICKYIKEHDETAKPIFREKIRRLIWGDKTTDAGVEETITDYNKLFNTDSACPPDNNYDATFVGIFPDATHGGKRKSRRNRKSKKSRKNHRKSARRRRR